MKLAYRKSSYTSFSAQRIYLGGRRIELEQRVVNCSRERRASKVRTRLWALRDSQVAFGFVNDGSPFRVGVSRSRRRHCDD